MQPAASCVKHVLPPHLSKSCVFNKALHAAEAPGRLQMAKGSLLLGLDQNAVEEMQERSLQQHMLQGICRYERTCPLPYAARS